jgi:hypothetical protein
MIRSNEDINTSKNSQEICFKFVFDLHLLVTSLALKNLKKIMSENLSENFVLYSHWFLMDFIISQDLNKKLNFLIL